MGEKPRAIGEATRKENSQPLTRDEPAQLRRESKTLLNWFEEAMKEKPRPIEEALSTARGHGEFNHSTFNAAPANQTHASDDKAGQPANQTHASDDKTGQAKQSNTNEEQDREDREGWQRVTYKRTTTKQAQRKTKPFFSKKVKQGYSDAFKNIRCFRCLAPGHKRINCREPIKCYRCHKYGHLSNSCKSTINQPKVHKSPPARQSNYTYQSYAQAVKGKEKGKETMETQEEFLNERPEEMDVFLPTRGTNLRPRTEHLTNSAWIVLTAGSPSLYLPLAIKTTLQRQHGWHTVELCTVLKGEGQSYLIICDNARLRDRLVTGGPYNIENWGVRFKLTPWTPTSEMSYHPLGYDTWIRLTGLPLQLWEDDEIKRVTEGIGTVKYIRPYGVQGQQYEHITLYMSTRHPTKITKSLRVWEGDFAKSVRVQLLRWRTEQQGYFPPPDLERRNQPSQHYTNNQESRQRGATTLNRPHFSPTGYYPSSDSRSDSIGGGSTGDWWAREAKPAAQVKRYVRKYTHKGIWIPKPSKVKVADREVMKVTSMKVHEKREELKVATQKTQETATSNFTLTWGSNAAEVQFINAGRFVLYKITQQPAKEIQNVIGLISIKEAEAVRQFFLSAGGDIQLSKYKSDQLAGGIKNTLEECNIKINQEVGYVLETRGESLFQGEQNLTGEAAQIQEVVEFNTQEQTISMGLACGPELEERPPGFDDISEFISEDGPTKCSDPQLKERPPSFENGPDFTSGLTNYNISEPDEEIHTPIPALPLGDAPVPDFLTEVRRSKRIREKYDGPYMTVIERAQKNLGYEGTTPHKARKKEGSAPQLTYMQNLDQLTQDQAEAVLATAGIGMEEDSEIEERGLGAATAAD